MNNFTSPAQWKRNFFFYGHIAKGVVYLLIGGIAVAATIGEASGPGGMRDVIRWIQEQAFGQVLLALMAVGLFFYCAWRWTKAIDDPGNEGTDAEGLVKRTAYAASGTVYGLLGVYAITLLTGNGGGGSSKQDVLSEILSQPWGQVLVGVIGLALVGAGIYQIVRGIREKYMEKLRNSSMNQTEEQVYRSLGKAGHLARGLVYGIMAYFMFRVALHNNPSEFRGIAGALDYLGGQAFGTVLVALVGLGLLLYGVFMFVKATYHRVA